MLFFIFYFPLPSRASRAGGRIQAESTFYIYIRGGSAYFVYPLFIVGSLPLFFCYVLPAPGLLATRRLPSPLLFSFFLFLFPFAEAYVIYTRMCIFVAEVECRSFIELSSYIGSRAIVGNSSNNFTVVTLWKRFYLAHETTSSSSSSSS